MKDYISIFNSLAKELNEMMDETCYTDEDIRRQELRLKQINATLNRCGKELKEKRKILKQQYNMLKAHSYNSQTDSVGN